jgi:hypothetical protein
MTEGAGNGKPENAETTQPSTSLDDFVDTSFSSGATTTIRHEIAVREKPDPQWFFMTWRHPEPEKTKFRLLTVTSDTGMKDKPCLVHPKLAGSVPEAKPVQLFLSVNTGGFPFLWWSPLLDNSWHLTKLACARESMDKWVKMVNVGGGYGTQPPEVPPTFEPIWPDQPYMELVQLGFRGRTINDLDHPVINKLRGRL